MKKVFFAAMAVVVFSSVSFAGTTEKIKTMKPTQLTLWYYHCGNGNSGSFWCNGCDKATALTIARTLC